MPASVSQCLSSSLIPSVRRVRRKRPLFVGRVESAFHPAMAHYDEIQSFCKEIAKKCFSEIWGRRLSRWLMVNERRRRAISGFGAPRPRKLPISRPLPLRALIAASESVRRLHGERRRLRCLHKLRPQRRGRRCGAERLAELPGPQHLLRPQRASPGPAVGSGARRRDRPIQGGRHPRRQARDRQHPATGITKILRVRKAPLDRDGTTITIRCCCFCFLGSSRQCPTLRLISILTFSSVIRMASRSAAAPPLRDWTRALIVRLRTGFCARDRIRRPRYLDGPRDRSDRPTDRRTRRKGRRVRRADDRHVERYLKSSWCTDELEWFDKQIRGPRGGERPGVCHSRPADRRGLWPDFCATSAATR